MKLTVNSAVLNELISKAIKGAGNNKLIPITSMICIEEKDNELRLTTTDATNYLYVCSKEFESDTGFYVTIQVDTFSKLIQKMTCEKVTLELENNVLTVIGNGKYKIELPLDENGEPVKFPDPLSTSFIIAKDDSQEVTYHNNTIKKAVIDSIINTAKSALAVTMEVPCCTGYYMGDKVIATDAYKVCGMNVTLFDTPKLLRAETVDLLSVMDDGDIAVFSPIEGKDLIFQTDNVILYTREMSGIEDYPVDAITELLKSDFESVCKVSKSAIMSMLDRLALFVGTYDKGAVILTFTKEGLLVSTKADSGQEIIPYIDSNNFKDFMCFVDIEMLQSQIKAQVGDVVTIYYGKDNAIKMVDGNVTQIVCLLEEV